MKKITFVLLILVAFLCASAWAEDVEDSPELPTPQNPGVAKTVRKEDAPLDHAVTKDAVREAIRKTGAGDPMKLTEPLGSHWTQSGKFPEDHYIYAIAPDGRVLGKGDKVPAGAKRMDVSVSMSDRGWYASIQILNPPKGGWVESEDSAQSGMGDADRLSSEQGKGFDSEMANLARSRQFDPSDPETAVRQAVVKLQTKGTLYDPSRDFSDSLGPKKSAGPSSRDIQLSGRREIERGSTMDK